MKNKYYFHKPLFWAGIFIAVLFVAMFVVNYGFKPVTYTVCKSYTGYCVEENGTRVPDGFETGTKPSFLFRNFELVMLVLFGFLFLVNHIVYNKMGVVK